jgi:hypothetical protein
VMVITELDAGNPDATMHALAAAGAPFGFFPPGPLWRPRGRTSEGDAVPPA